MSKEGGDLGQDRQVELWKVKKLIKSLQQARGFVSKLKFVAAPIFTNHFEECSQHSKSVIFSMIGLEPA